MNKRGRPRKVPINTIQEVPFQKQDNIVPEPKRKTSAPDPIEAESDEITDKAMETHLITLSNTIYWKSIVRYIGFRETFALDALKTTDPFKAPTEMARNQGIRMGLLDLLEYVRILKENRAKTEREKEEGSQ